MVSRSQRYASFVHAVAKKEMVSVGAILPPTTFASRSRVLTTNCKLSRPLVPGEYGIDFIWLVGMKSIHSA